MRLLITSSAFLLLASNAFCVTVSLIVSPARCGNENGSIYAAPDGGLPPYTFSWSNGETIQLISFLAPGDYTVTVTDGLGNTAQATGTVTAIWAMEDVDGAAVMPIQPDCMGMCTGIAQFFPPFGGTLPYNYAAPNMFPGGPNGEVTIMGLCAVGGTDYVITDANGCPGYIGMPFVPPVSPSQVTVQGSTPACEGQSNGSMTLYITDGAASAVEVSRIGGGYSQTHYPSLMVPYVVNGLPAGDYDITSSIQGGPMGTLCSLQFSGTVPEIAAPCGGVSGRVYHDADQDCTFGGFDLPIPNKVLEITPGPEYAITAWDGAYTRGMLFGNFAIGQSLNNETQVCPPANPEAFTLNLAVPQAAIDFANVSNAPHDLSVSICSSTARPGFPTQAWITVINNSPFPSGDVTLDLAFDPLLLNPSPANGQWSIGVIPPFAWETRGFHADVPANINLLGTVISYSATATNTTSEANTGNNTAVEDVTITGSYDPNDKQGITSSGLGASQYFLAQDEWIDYTVRFQNTGTAAAETVVVRDTIDADLFIPSLEILGASHDFTPSFGQGRELIFTFDNINLPDSTTDLLGSQGFISYRIKPNNDVIVGTLLENIAGIYFDFNPPIITNTVTHVVDLSTKVQSEHLHHLHLQPNPASHQLWISSDGSIDAISIQAADGREIVHHALRATSSTIDVSSLRAGAYFLLATMNNGSAVRERFIKQ